MTTKIKPTDEQINHLMAVQCGWAYNPTQKHYTRRQTQYNNCVPDYCNDAKFKPEIYALIVGSFKEYDFVNFALNAVPSSATGNHVWFELMFLHQRAYVIAALQSLALWPQDWEA